MLSQTMKLHDAALAADIRWQAELERTYGRDAGDARYDSRLNRATPQLAKLHDEFRAACEAWRPSPKPILIRPRQ